MALEKIDGNYKLTQPDGGWGYVIVIAITVIMIATIVPLGVFGVIFGKFLENIEDDSSGTTLVYSTYNGIYFFVGIVANVLLNKYSFRVVALLGSTINFFGAIATFYASSLSQVMFTFGFMQGIGSGLLMPASMSSLNAYFNKKMALMTSLSNTIMVIGYIIVPYITNWTLELYGYRGTLLLLAGLSAFCFPASLALYPVEEYLKKVKIGDDNIVNISVLDEQDHFTLEPLVIKESLENGEHVIHRVIDKNGKVKSYTSIKEKINEEEKEDSFWQSLAHSMDLHLLADPKYLNITIGLALSFLADVAFFPILPSLMTKFGFGPSEVASMISVFFAADLAARITLSAISAFCQVNSLLLVFVSSGLSAILRIALLMNHSKIYVLIVLAGMGYMRCFIQTPQSLVMAHEYPDKFESAYSLYMVVTGVASLIFGFVMRYIKTVTNSDIYVYHLLTASFIVPVITWSIGFLRCRKKSKS